MLRSLYWASLAPRALSRKSDSNGEALSRGVKPFDCPFAGLL